MIQTNYYKKLPKRLKKYNIPKNKDGEYMIYVRINDEEYNMPYNCSYPYCENNEDRVCDGWCS